MIMDDFPIQTSNPPVFHRNPLALAMFDRLSRTFHPGGCVHDHRGHRFSAALPHSAVPETRPGKDIGDFLK